ncbi:MAG: caspase family protein [Pseudomonadota bacterium]
MKQLKILCVHGVGNHPVGGPWEGAWKSSIQDSIRNVDPEIETNIEFVYLDSIFIDFKINAVDVLEALFKLGSSGAGNVFRQPKGLGDIVRWTAGMIVQWVENDKLRTRTRQALEQRMAEFQPDIVCAHSLGSLVAYDCFTGSGKDLLQGVRFVSCGSQIGNPFVIGNFDAGRISELPQAKFWYHLFNSEDAVFTAQIRLSSPNFTQVETFFDIDGVADHDVTQYMSDARTVETVWTDVIMDLHNNLPRRVLPPKARLSANAKKIARPPQRRALLVGINEYADPSQNLEGCVNDVFLMSSLLQESGFEAEDIRVVLNERATHQGLCERLKWLLDDAQDGDVRFLYYSGHGAQVPAYGMGDKVDRLDETLVLHDFDWSRERSFTDDDFHSLYSQLPYGVQFLAVFDCCHSGGMTRAGGRKIRGIDPPDDIRHRMLRWDAKREMWVERELVSPQKEFDKHFNSAKRSSSSTMKKPSATHRLGQAMDLRAYTPAKLNAKAKSRGHHGPYLPVIIHASREDQFSYEYQHGAIAHGAFTYCLVKAVRADRRLKKPKLTFNSLIALVGKELAGLGYEQEPGLVAPSSVKSGPVPIK